MLKLNVSSIEQPSFTGNAEFKTGTIHASFYKVTEQLWLMWIWKSLLLSVHSDDGWLISVSYLIKVAVFGQGIFSALAKDDHFNSWFQN